MLTDDIRHQRITMQFAQLPHGDPQARALRPKREYLRTQRRTDDAITALITYFCTVEEPAISHSLANIPSGSALALVSLGHEQVSLVNTKHGWKTASRCSRSRRCCIVSPCCMARGTAKLEGLVQVLEMGECGNGIDGYD